MDFFNINSPTFKGENKSNSGSNSEINNESSNRSSNGSSNEINDNISDKNDTEINNNFDISEEDFLNELLEEPLPNEIKYHPPEDIQNHNITRDEFIEMQVRNEIQKQNANTNKNNQINLQNQLAKKRREAELEQEDLDMLHEYILTGKIVQKAQIYGTTWHMHILTVQESRDAIQRSEEYNSDSQQLAQALFVLSYAVEQIEGHYFHSFDEARSFLEKLSLHILYEAVNKYNELFRRQEDVMMEPQQIRALIHDDFLRIKYQVMRNSGLVPADDRVRKMNDAQWLWYYYNMDEDMEQKTDIRQSELDYLGVFINPKMAQEMIKVNEQNRKRRKLEKEKAFKKNRKRSHRRRIEHNKANQKIQKTTESKATDDFLQNKLTNNAITIMQDMSSDNISKSTNTSENVNSNNENINSNNDTNNNRTNYDDSYDNSYNDTYDDTDYNDGESILDQAFGNASYHTSDGTVVNSDFERELRAALNLKDGESIEDQFVEVAGDTGGGNPYESEEDFMERVRAFLPFAGTNYGYSKPQKVRLNNIQRKSSQKLNQPNLDNGSNDNSQYTFNRIQKGKSLITTADNIPQQLVSNHSKLTTSTKNNSMQNNSSQDSFIQNMSLSKNGITSSIDIPGKSNISHLMEPPKWKQDSDYEFMKKTGITSLDSLNNMNINKQDEIKKLSDNMDFFDIDDE